METNKKRDVKLDIIRIFALLTVISVHFFLNSGFYNEIVSGKKMYIMCIFRSFFMICVPMFITLTGYLLNKKELSKNYYKGIFKTLLIYFTCSIIYSIFTKFYLKEKMDIIIFLENLLDYSGTRYSWYIEMYIGLFLIIPFLNIIFNNIKTKKEAKALLIILFISIGLPNIVNIFKLDSPKWWIQPSVTGDYIKILPSWWADLYPIFYYFLGAYLKKYPIKINTIYNMIILIIITILDGTFNFYRSNQTTYIGGSWNTYCSASIMIITFLTFNLLLNTKVNSESKKINKVLKILSDACLGAYLLSCIFDKIIYSKLETLIPVVKDRFVYAPIIILAVFLGSIITSIIINLIYKLIQLLLESVQQKGKQV